MQDSDFRALADECLARIEAALADQAEDAELADGILKIVFADGATYLINRHMPNREIWLSSPTSGAHHFRHQGSEWRSTRGGADLRDLLDAEFSARLGRAIRIAR